jgi:hypothetical protein
LKSAANVKLTHTSIEAHRSSSLKHFHDGDYLILTETIQQLGRSVDYARLLPAGWRCRQQCTRAHRKPSLKRGMHFLRLYNTGKHRLIGGPMSAKDLAMLVLLLVVVLVVVHLWFGSHAPTNLQPFAGFPGGHPG